jgi:hypothetical protein
LVASTLSIFFQARVEFFLAKILSPSPRLGGDDTEAKARRTGKCQEAREIAESFETDADWGEG